jgi:hypothetical protein
METRANKTNSAKPYGTMILAMALFGSASAGCAMDGQMEGEDQELESLGAELEASSPQLAMLVDPAGREKPDLTSADGSEIGPLHVATAYHGSDYATCDHSHLNAHDIECDNHGVYAEGYDDGGYMFVFDNTGCGGSSYAHGDGTNIWIFRVCENYEGCSDWYYC